MKLILINAPPYAGKDTAADAITRYHNVNTAVIIERMSMPLKRAFAGFMHVPVDYLGNVGYYERHKEETIDILVRWSYRNWQIAFSETFCKPLFGLDIFGRLLWSRIEIFNNQKNTLIVVPDCGFQIEIDYIINKIPHNNIMVMQIERPGCTFKRDSREWIKVPDTVTHLRILNDGTKADFEDLIIQTTKDWIHRT